jgi:DNA-binding transcriptional LysR family regulator
MLGMVSMHKSMPKPSDQHSLDRLGILRAVVEAGSFVGAGEALGLTQPAVSRAVSRLEERVGVRLFRRSARSIALTEEGREFYESIAPHLRAIEEATSRAGAAKAKVRGTLRVNVDPGTAQFVLVPHLEPFFEQHPELMVDLVVRDRLGDFEREGFDVAVRVGNPKPSSLKARLLMRTQILTCASPAYLARHGTPRRPADIEQHRCILMRDPSSSGHFPWELVRGKKVVPLDVKGPLLVNQFGPMLAACVAGQGLAQLLDFHVKELLADGKLVQILPEWADETYPLYAYHHAAQHQSAKVRAFLDYVVAITRRPAKRT